MLLLIFLSHETVANFAIEFNRRKWPKSLSSKICNISYARLQGKAAFIEHFRNSSLMNENPAYRPLIFYSAGALKGLPEPFPEPRYDFREYAYSQPIEI